jgi:hypothetical protein
MPGASTNIYIHQGAHSANADAYDMAHLLASASFGCTSMSIGAAVRSTGNDRVLYGGRMSNSGRNIQGSTSVYAYAILLLAQCSCRLAHPAVPLAY